MSISVSGERKEEFAEFTTDPNLMCWRGSAPASPGGVLPQGIEISMISGGDHPIMCSCRRHQAVTEDCARRRVHASNRRSRLLASRRNAGGNVYVSSLSRLLPALNSSPFLFRPPSGATFPPGEGAQSAGAYHSKSRSPTFFLHRKAPRRMPRGLGYER